MKNLTIYKRKGYIVSLLAVTMLAGTFGCKKGTFEINGDNPNSPTAVPPKYALSAALSGTANLMYSGVGNVGGNNDIINNWMGYWTQSGAYTPSNTFVLYQLTSGTGSGNWDVAYNNLSNYHAMIANLGSDASLSNFKAVGMIMTSFVYQRIVDLYNKAPYTGALVANSKFSYPYDDGSVIYKSITAKLDSAVALIKANPSAADIGSADIVFGGDMTMWVKFANTLKLKILMRQTQQSSGGSLGDAGVKTALTGYTTADFLGAGEDAIANPGYSNAADAQENPLYLDVVATATGNPGINQKYYRANAYAVGFYQAHNDPRDSMFYYPNDAAGVIKGRVYGSTNGTEANSIISAISAFGRNSSGDYNGPSVGAPIIAATESLFLQAEAIQRGYLTGTLATVYNKAVSESFRLVGVPNASTAAATYVGQADPFTNITLSTNKINTIITQKWAALNGIDPVESYSDYRRLGIPTVPVSAYPGNTATHIPYRLPYPTSELNYNSANVPDGGTGTESLTSKIFWMP
ncbi:MAG TPA: SusD/RagB family nutrient-binding outer membrane lipoprotein [Mucilaginibacter sp.]|nr:SusD/RagB family nutrient-binding outer membrane lipoprotein [Mucilaginibacter sp.]